MRTQSMDTSPEAEQFQIALIRKAPLTKRFGLVRSLSYSTLYTNRQNIQELHPDISEEEQSLIFVTDIYGQALANGLRGVLEERTTKVSDTPDILAVMKSVIDIFEQLGIAYYISGSVASSVYGMAQAAQDIDIIANLQPEHLQPLIAQLQTDYYVDEDAVREAIQQRTWFNAIHLESILKIDVFLPKDRPFDQQVFSRIQQHILEENYPPFSMVSPEDSILTQLEWHHRGDKVADDRWNAILGVLKVRSPTLDLAYLQQWATALEIDNLLEQALIDAGLKE
jgi:hypothetical protein